jgi:hypothetical protein
MGVRADQDLGNFHDCFYVYSMPLFTCTAAVIQGLNGGFLQDVGYKTMTNE